MALRGFGLAVEAVNFAYPRILLSVPTVLV